MFPPFACRPHVEIGTKFPQRGRKLSTEALWRTSACGYVAYEATVTESPRRIVPPARTSA
jgi:hypothetical protein